MGMGGPGMGGPAPGQAPPGASPTGGMPFGAAPGQAPPGSSPTGGIGGIPGIIEEAAAPVNPLLEPVAINLEEKVTATLTKEGGLVDNITIDGKLQLTANDASRAGRATLFINKPAGFQLKAHPNLDKGAFAENRLELREGKSYTAGSTFPLLKWNNRAAKEDTLPVTVAAWPSECQVHSFFKFIVDGFLPKCFTFRRFYCRISFIFVNTKPNRVAPK